MSSKKVKICSFFLIFVMFSCKKKLDQSKCNYIVSNVYDQLNLNDSRFFKLNSDNNYVYYAQGAKGVIVFRASSAEYRVFERASPIDPTNTNATLYVNATGLQIVDSVHNQIWDMEGLPYSGSSTCLLKKYNSYIDGSYLVISN